MPVLIIRLSLLLNMPVLIVLIVDPGPLGNQRRGLGAADSAAVGKDSLAGQLFQRGSRAIAADRPAARRPSSG